MSEPIIEPASHIFPNDLIVGEAAGQLTSLK